MTPNSRRRFLATGLATLTGAAGLATADRLAARYGLIPPDHGGIFGPGETLTYAVQRLLTARRPVRQFPRGMISKAPFANEIAPAMTPEFKRLQAGGFKDWRLQVDGLVAHPLALSIADLQALAIRSQITEVACEEGWSYIAEWIGTPLGDVLREAGVQPQARYAAYFSFQRGWWDSLDLEEARHPTTFLTWGMNDGDLPVPFGGPLRLRVPRQIGYKSIKFITRITLTDSMKKFGQGLGSVEPEAGYAWYAGI